MENKRYTVSVALFGVAVLVLGILAYQWPRPSVPLPPASEAPLVADDGKQLPKEKLIIVDEPLPDTEVISPLVVTGRARGAWYFEANFPVKLYDANGTEIVQGIAQANGEWMTEAFVPFSATLIFAQPITETGSLVFEKDNPSGLSEHDDSVSIPVMFGKQKNEPPARKNTLCKPTGCSGQICSDEDIITTCEYRPEYACYKGARCERQASGECGWTQTPEMTQCLNSSKK